MIKGLGRFFRTVLFLALLGLVGYNTMELRKLQAELVLLREQNRRAETPAPAIKPAAVFAPGWVGEAQAHVERARFFLRSKRYDEARVETQAALALVQKKAETARNESALRLEQGRAAAQTVSHEAASLWNQINRLTRLSKQGTGAAPLKQP